MDDGVDVVVIDDPEQLWSCLGVGKVELDEMGVADIGRAARAEVIHDHDVVAAWVSNRTTWLPM